MKSPTEGGGGLAGSEAKGLRSPATGRWQFYEQLFGGDRGVSRANSLGNGLPQRARRMEMESVEPTLWAMAFPRERVGWRWSPLPDPPEPLP